MFRFIKVGVMILVSFNISFYEFEFLLGLSTVKPDVTLVFRPQYSWQAVNSFHLVT